MIKLLEPDAAGQLGRTGVRSWIVFTVGAPSKPSGAMFWIYGPWAIQGTEYGAVGDYRRGWRLRWSTSNPFTPWEIEVPVFADIMRVAKLGPTGMAKVIMDMHERVAEKTRVHLLRAGRSP